MTAITTPITLETLYRYPVKGLSPEPLESVKLVAGATVPFDRAWAIENGPGRFDPEAPRHLPKITFLMLMRDERLATLRSRFDETTATLTIERDGKPVARGDLSTPIGRKMIEQFIAAYMRTALRGAPRIVSAPGHSFSDVAQKCVHIVNLASVRELARVSGRAIDPLRFRANLHIDGLPAFAERGLVGRTLAIGDVRLSPFADTTRCAATEVDPATGARDIAVPSLIRRQWGHEDFGIYAMVDVGGTIRRGDAVTIL